MYRALIFSVLASPAWAICPVADDLQTGIRLTADDGAVETYVAQTPDIVELTITYDDGYADQSLLAHGVYLLEVTALQDGQPQPGTQTTYVYPVKPEAMPVPAAGDVWRTRAIVDSVNDDKISAQWDEPIQMTYGTCSYTVLPGEITYAGIGYRQTEGLHYLPELGLAYLTRFETDSRDDVDEYTVISITAVEPGE
ncbi:MAG: hypothetical protein II336_15065 [Loktanella sp.]|nr:hypothetical protein [Loktanella sp.]